MELEGPLTPNEYPTPKKINPVNTAEEELKDKRRISAAKLLRAGAGVAALTVLGTVTWQVQDKFIANPHTSIEESIGSFDNSFNSGPQIVPSQEVKPSKDEVFDNTKEKGVIDINNARLMSEEEYTKIAPQTIERDSVNIPITIVSKDGQIRKLSFWRETGGFSGTRRICKNTPCKGDNIVETISTQNVISFSGWQEGDIFSSPIDAEEIYYYGGDHRTNPDGTLPGTSITMQGYDQNGNHISLSMPINARIRIIKEMPNYDDYVG